MQNNRLPRTNATTQLMSEVHSLQLVVQEISDLLSDREQVIDSLSQEVNHLHSRIDQLEQQLSYAQQRPSLGSLHHSQVLHQPEPMYTSSSLSAQDRSLPVAEPELPSVIPDDFVEKLSLGIEKAIAKSLQSNLAAPIVHHVVPATTVPPKSAKKKKKSFSEPKETPVKHHKHA